MIFRLELMGARTVSQIFAAAAKEAKTYEEALSGIDKAQKAVAISAEQAAKNKGLQDLLGMMRPSTPQGWAQFSAAAKQAGYISGGPPPIVPPPVLKPPEGGGMDWSKLLGGGRVLTLVAVGLFALVKAIEALIDALKTWQKMYWSSPWSGDTAKLSAIAAAAGMDPSKVAADASALPGGAKQLISRIRAISNASSDVQARQMARVWGMEDYLTMRDLPASERDKAMAGVGGVDDSPSSRGRLQGATKVWNDFMNHFKQIASGFFEGTPILYMFFGLLKQINGLWEQTISSLGSFNEWLKGLGLDGIMGGLGGLMGGMAGKINNAADKQVKAADKMSDAVTDLVGVFGGISKSRARGAFPEAWGYYGNQDYAVHHIVRMGQFGVA